MLAVDRLGTVDLVKVAHHGSADQSERLYAELDATVGVIGVGAENGYGHPTDRLLDLLARGGHHGGAHRPLGNGDAHGRRRGRVPALVGAGRRRRPPVDLTRNGEVRWQHDQERRDPGRRARARPRVRRPRRSRSWRGTQVRPAPVVLVTGPENVLAERASGMLRDFLRVRGSRARGERPRGRRLPARRAPHPREPVAVRRAAAHPRRRRREVRATTSSSTRSSTSSRPPSPPRSCCVTRGGQRGKKLLDADPRRRRRRHRDRLRRTEEGRREAGLRGGRVPRGRAQRSSPGASARSSPRSPTTSPSSRPRAGS